MLQKKLVQEKGILSDPNPKKGRRLNVEVVKQVEEFYLSEEISRTMPGKKDTISVSIHTYNYFENQVPIE